MDSEYISISLANLFMEHIGFGDENEHYGRFPELEELDLSHEDQARPAIRKWLLPPYRDDFGRSEVGRKILWCTFQVCLTRWGFMPATVPIPGITVSLPDEMSEETYYLVKRRFYGWVWDEIFHEPFVRLAVTSGLQERIDVDIVNFKHNPYQWTNPQYGPIEAWDSCVGVNCWKDFPRS